MPDKLPTAQQPTGQQNTVVIGGNEVSAELKETKKIDNESTIDALKATLASGEIQKDDDEVDNDGSG